MKNSWRLWWNWLVTGGATRKNGARRKVQLNLEVLEERTVLSAATHFAIVGLPNPIPVGTVLTFTVEALDANNNIDTGYDGTTHLRSTDGKAVLPASAPLKSGVGTFSATLGTIGSQSITVTGPPYDGAGTFVNAPGSPISVISAYSFKVGGNLSGGNTFDLMETSGYYGSFAVLLGNGNGTFSQLPLQTTGEGGGVGPNSAAIGDFRGNGIEDLAFVDNNAFINVVLGNGDGTFGPPATYNVGNNPRSIVAGSFNGSAEDDLAVLNTSDGTITILMANPQGSYGTTFLVPTTILTVGVGGSVAAPQAGSNNPLLAVGHFTNDGNLDLAVVNSNANAVEVFLGNGNGTFRPGLTFAAGSSPYSIAAADLNNDGNNDIVVNNPSGGIVSVLMGNGNGTFQSPAAYGAGPNPGVPVIADMNGDGTPDIVLNESDQNEVAILLGNGNGTFRPAPFLASPNNGNTPVIVGDLTGDGLPDIAVGAINVYLNQPLTGTTAVIEAPGPASHFTVSTSSTAAVGKPAVFTVTAFDQFNDATTDYSGTLSFTSSDSAATFPAGATLTNGVGLFSVTFKSLGNQTLTIADSVLGSITGVSNPVAVSPAATHLGISARSTATAGSSFTFTVIALDSTENTALSYNGTILLTSSDSRAALPVSGTLASGMGVFTVTLKTAGNQTLSAADSLASSISGSSNPIAVSPGITTRFISSAIPANTTAGVPFGVTVTALDALNNVATGYTGSVHIAVSVDTQASLPLNSNLNSGIGIFSVTLRTAGNLAFSIADSATFSITGVNANIAVAPTSAAYLGFRAPGNVSSGGTIGFTVTAYDQFNNTAASYGGSVLLSSSDSQAVFSSNTTLAGGSGVFSVTLKSVGNQTLIATDSASSTLTGASSAIVVLGLPATHFVVTGSTASATIGSAFSFTVEALDASNNLANGYNGTVHFTSSDSHTTLPAPGPLSAGIGVFSATLQSLGSQTITVKGAAPLGPTFGSPPVPPVGLNSASSVLTGGDVNGDGSFDLIGASTYYSNFTVYPNFGNASFAFGNTYGSGFDAGVMITGDFNGDGKLDVAIPNTTTTVAAFLGNGDGTFGPGFSYLVGNRPVATVAGDFNNDNRQDVAVINTQDNTMSILLANPSGLFGTTFGSATNYPLAGGSSDIATGDFNHDGKLDLATVSNSGVQIFLNNGNGTFKPGVIYAAGSAPSQLGVADFNADGKLDVVVNNQAANLVTVILGNGDGTFRKPTVFGAGINPGKPSVADLNGDGKPDLILPNINLGQIAVLLGNGDGTFAPGPFVSANTYHVYSLVVGDMNGDGTPDVASVAQGGLSVFIDQPITGSATVAVGAAAATHFKLTTPSISAAGKPASVTVIGLDQFNDTATDYAGSVVFSSSDGAAVFPSAGNLTSGVGTFSFTLQTQGIQTLTATDSMSSSITGFSAPITVSGAATHFIVGASNNALAGNNTIVTVTALDSANNTAAGYSGTVLFSSSDANAVFPTNSTMSNGVGAFSVQLKTIGAQTVTAIDSVVGTITGQSNTITVGAGPTTHFSFNGIPVNATAGTLFVFTVLAQDAFNNTAPGYTGSVHFTATDSQAGLPVNTRLTSGTGVFSATLKTSGSQVITANDSANVTLSGFSNTITVAALGATHFVISGPTSTSSNAPFVVTIIAQDPYNNTATNYSGTVELTSSDSQAQLNIDSTLTGGVGYFGALLQTVGKQTLTASDVSTSSLTGTTAVTVVAAPASHFVVSAPAFVYPGSPFVFTVIAEDPSNNIAISYSGTVGFSGSDSHAVLPPSGKLTSGVGRFAVVLTTSGLQTLTATDTATSSITGSSDPILVNSAPATHFAVSAPAATPLGRVRFTVTAEDQYNNTDTNYVGTLLFASSDSTASLPDNATMSGGTGVFSAMLHTMGGQALTVTDVAYSSISGASALIVVNPPVTHFVISGEPSSILTGVPFTITVSAEDPANNIAISYGGSVALSSSDSAVIFAPASAVLSGGQGVFTVTLKTVGDQTLTATDTATSSLTAASDPIAVVAAPTHFAVIPSTNNIQAGNAFILGVIAEDASNNTVTGYSGIVHFTSADSRAGLPGDVSLANGVGVFAAVLNTSGNQIITANDTSIASITGVSSSILVSPAAPTHFAVTAALPTYPGVVTGPKTFASTGSAFQFTVSALDAEGNVVPNYSGNVSFSSSDTVAGIVLPQSATLNNGVGTFSATLKTPGNQTITASDVANGISGTTSPIVTRGLVVTGFTPTPSGFTVTFNKPFNINAVNLYTLPSVGLPDDVILATAGSQVSVHGSLVINSPTSMTFVKTDQIGATGTFNPASGLLAPGNYTVTLRSFRAGNSGFEDSLGAALDGANSGKAGSNFQITFAVGTLPVAVGIPDFARGPAVADAIFLPSTIGNGNTFTLIFTNSAANPPTGTATVVFSTNASVLQANIQNALTSSSGGLFKQIGVGSGGVFNASVAVINDVASGANVQVTFQNALATTTNHLTSSTGGVTTQPAIINVANAIPGSGIPIVISNGQGVTSGSFTLQYNPGLLNISGVVSKLTIPGATFTMVSNDTVAGVAVFSLSSPSRLLIASSTAVTLGSLQATVPLSATASYGAKQLLQFTSAQLNGSGGPIAVVSADAVQVAAYFGDVTGTGGPLGQGDAQAITAVASGIANPAAQTIPGFAAFPNLDPIIIGGVALQSSVTLTDAGVMGQQASGATKATIPFAPTGLSITPAGPDPTLSVPSLTSNDSRQDTVTVPVNIDTAHPDGSTGMVDAMLALTYDPKLFDVSDADVQLGSVPAASSGWQLQTTVNAQTGLIGVELFSNTPIQSTSGGSLITVTMHVRGEMPVGTAALTLVPYVDPSGSQRVYQTQVSDSQSAFVLEIATDTERTADLPIAAKVGNPIAVAVLEQVFGDGLPFSTKDQPLNADSPSAILALESGDRWHADIRDLAVSQAPAGMGMAEEWLTEDWSASLDQFPRRGCQDSTVELTNDVEAKPNQPDRVWWDEAKF